MASSKRSPTNKPRQPGRKPEDLSEAEIKELQASLKRTLKYLGERELRLKRS